jgi:formylmethanofuran dehydrogenase subunit E-like metal-binding protein
MLSLPCLSYSQILGDANADGKVNLSDSIFSLKILGGFVDTEQNSDTAYSFFRSLGRIAASESIRLLGEHSQNLIVMTNAGYAQIHDKTTEAVMDGLNDFTGAKRGDNSLLEIHSHYNWPLWTAIYDKNSGKCAYHQFNSERVPQNFSESLTSIPMKELFTIQSVDQINADHLYANAETYADKFDKQKIFGSNAFRVVTIANAVAAGTPMYAIRSFEFHDHYCTGVTSGILMVNYIKKNFPADSYFVHTVSPWCKEDALMSILNATPGKSSYAVSYPTSEDTALWKTEARNAATIFYRQNSESNRWEGILTGYQGGETGCPDYRTSTITKLCSDLWYLERLDQPELFVSIIKSFELPEGVTPKDWARPGVDPMKKLDLCLIKSDIESEPIFWMSLADKAATTAIDRLNNASNTGETNLIVLTNAGYAMINGHSTEACLDGLQSEKTKATVGTNSLVALHSTPNQPLWFFFYEKISGNGVYCEVDSTKIDLTTTQLSLPNVPFSKVLIYNIKADTEHLYANFEYANQDLFINKGFGGNESRIIAIANALALNVPHDLIKAFQYHDHLCPGVTAGYLIVKYVQAHYPLNNIYDKYFVLSMPPWCKDDAIMTLLNTTPGKSGYGVYYLNDTETAQLKSEAANLAVIIFRHNSVTNDWEGQVIGFDWGTSKQENNWGENTSWNWWESRLKMDIWFLDYLDKPEQFVKVIKQIDSFANFENISQPSDLVHPGINPLQIFDLIQ